MLCVSQANETLAALQQAFVCSESSYPPFPLNVVVIRPGNSVSEASTRSGRGAVLLESALVVVLCCGGTHRLLWWHTLSLWFFTVVVHCLRSCWASKTALVVVFFVGEFV